MLVWRKSNEEIAKSRHFMKKILALAILLTSLCSHARADGPSTYEGAGLLDAYIQLCGDSNPSKAAYYRNLILTAFSCHKPTSELEENIKMIRENKDAQVRAAYQRYFDFTLKGMEPVTREQKMEFCEHFSESKC